MSSPHIHFFDAANPHNVASGVHAAVPIDGIFAHEWGQEIHRMGRVIRYTVLGGAAVAHKARGIDIESGDRANDPDFYVPFLVERQKHYRDAVPYVNRSNIGTVAQHCKNAGLNPNVLHWWVSTLDGTLHVDVPGGQVWAVQFETVHGADISVLYGADTFVRP